jgi:hypothetical protein
MNEKKRGKENKITRKKGKRKEEPKERREKETNQQTKRIMKISIKNEFIFQFILSHYVIPTSQPFSSCHGKTLP